MLQTYLLREPLVTGLGPGEKHHLLAICRGELSAVIGQLMSVKWVEVAERT